ncbi:MAG: hypothetical protein JRE43_00145 [Deltaproteobacteria bacterium]|nr:hypothetical protein [Deltaproteobacteria bacterium]
MLLGKLQTNRWEAGFIALLFCFSVWIMFHTFSYDYENSTILIANKMWSDFAATLPLIRSFSMGDNWPPEYPIFPGSPIRYHYLFFLIVGKLEAIGIPLHWALNVPSVIGFFLLLSMIYLLGKKWFGDPRIGVLGVVFFLFNGSMGFMQFFAKNPLSWSTVPDIFLNSRFSAMGPWDGGDVLGVWHLLVFISQRHFSVSLGILLSFIFVYCYLDGKSRKTQLQWAVVFGLVIGVFPVFHKAVLLIFAIVMSVYFVLLPFSRWFLFATGAVSVLVMGLLWLLSFNLFGAPAGAGWDPGVMIQGPLSVASALKFFWYQFGLHSVLIPLGFCLVPRRVKILMLPAVIAFLVAFLFRFSKSESLLGHKFLSFFLILGQLLTAFVVVKFYGFISTRFPRVKLLPVGATAVLVCFLTLTGVIDFLPILNMNMAKVRDVGSKPEVKWFAENTPGDAVVLTSQFLYAPASVAGRKIFLGYGYFTDSAGYDTRGRRKIVDAVYSGESREEMCELLHSNNISFVDVEDFKPNKGRPTVNAEYFKANFTPRYTADNNRYFIYSTDDLCD